MSNARQIAFDLLCGVQQGEYPLDHLLDAAADRFEDLSRPDRALAHALIYGTLRWQGRLDHVIDFWGKKPEKIDPRVRIVLRMALFQFLFMDRVPQRAIVHSAVELTKRNGRRYAAGFVNGVLRRALAAPEQVVWPDAAQDPVGWLATHHALPPWLARRWIERWGLTEAEALCTAINTIPEVTLRVNTLRTDRDALLQALGQDTEQIRTTHHSPEGIVVAGFKRSLTQWSSYQAGLFQVQDEAAQLVTHLVAPQPGETIWDACAGLGTKTAHLAQLMDHRGTLLAADRQGTKLDRLENEMTRLGITMVRRQVMDLEIPNAADGLPSFDRILVDAPCSGLGVLRKNPDGKWHTRPADLARCRQRQLTLLNSVAVHVRNGGRLVYAVCSMEPEENEGVVEQFLQNRSDFAIYRPEMNEVASPETFLTSEGYLKTMPHRHGMDGFFAVCLVRSASSL
ncbi:16S rRNA (cytosine(967)-C(5))-methyltransferase RsmB [Desulfatitalea alkaliphila]|uniref:16S rRNA (cytosine(967)-C(5))-methyltransferase n=1 Tax=Desulfatitalea alkaliphila TaxID=2929485 RepID=A0AA41R213_9BACT|nr:16S rRNA (cytosine(967)-C(5))-methyltransferase RsmB [Desulfatitalea alkaliphila]MCJ8500574.1 16S rRNA (cytosine(967)-C(5))-methyltransferase RsmB [Desulfatitalea alkaliphila]